MIDAQKFVSGLGKADDSKEVAALLASLGAKKKPRPSRDGDDTLVTFPKEGMTLTFSLLDPKSSELTLVDVQFYADEDGFKRFAGKLPDGVAFGDSRAEAKKKLGKPTRTKKEFRLEIWAKKGYELTLEYTPDDHASVVYLSVPVTPKKKK